MTTKTTPLAVSSLHVKNFKAIRDSGMLQLTPLTVFVGNNGVGKSSVVEALEAVHMMARDGLDAAIDGRWRGFEYIRNQSSKHAHNSTKNGATHALNSISFMLEGRVRDLVGPKRPDYTFRASSEITADPSKNSVSYYRENLEFIIADRIVRTVNRSLDGETTEQLADADPVPIRISDTHNVSILITEPSIVRWQFVRLNPSSMEFPTRQRRVAGRHLIEGDGANLAEFILLLKEAYPQVLQGIIETLQFVLPYARDLEPVITSEIGRSVYVQLTEQGFTLPSWLFSTGTLRVLALLAILRNPDLPPLIAIEEIENGLDPRTISLIVDEIREVVRTGRSQIIITTHSPYLLDLLPLESIVFVERIDGEPRFFRPQNDESVQRWSEEFAPGRLYTMGRFRHAS